MSPRIDYGTMLLSDLRKAARDKGLNGTNVLREFVSLWIKKGCPEHFSISPTNTAVKSFSIRRWTPGAAK